jgi:hypothetical protein
MILAYDWVTIPKPSPARCISNFLGPTLPKGGLKLNTLPLGGSDAVAAGEGIGEPQFWDRDLIVNPIDAKCHRAIRDQDNSKVEHESLCGMPSSS